MIGQMILPLYEALHEECSSGIVETGTIWTVKDALSASISSMII